MKIESRYDRSKITPEIAANVVRDYLLPMFETDGKRLLKKKNNKLKESIEGKLIKVDQSIEKL